MLEQLEPRLMLDSFGFRRVADTSDRLTRLDSIALNTLGDVAFQAVEKGKSHIYISSIENNATRLFSITPDSDVTADFSGIEISDDRRVVYHECIGGTIFSPCQSERIKQWGPNESIIDTEFIDALSMPKTNTAGDVSYVASTSRETGVYLQGDNALKTIFSGSRSPNLNLLGAEAGALGEAVFYVNNKWGSNRSAGLYAGNGGVPVLLAGYDQLTPELSIQDVVITESDTRTKLARFRVELSHIMDYPVTVRFKTVQGSAEPGVDYESQSGEITIPAGASGRTIDIAVLGDRDDEASESFLVTLRPNDVLDPYEPAYRSPVRIIDDTAYGYIRDDESTLPTASISDAQVREGDVGRTDIQFRVSLSKSSEERIIIPFRVNELRTQYGFVAEFSARSDIDFMSPSQSTVTFEPGDTEEFITVEVIGDTLNPQWPEIERDEQFIVELLPSAGVSLLDPSGVGTIQEDDEFILTRSFSSNDLGAVVLYANLNSSLQSQSAVYAHDGTQLHLIAATGSRFAGLGNQGSGIGVAGLSHWDDLAINNIGEILFFASNLEGIKGIYRSSNGIITEMVSEGDQLDGSRIKYLTELKLNNVGHIAFRATLENGIEGVYLSSLQKRITGDELLELFARDIAYNSEWHALQDKGAEICTEKYCTGYSLSQVFRNRSQPELGFHAVGATGTGLPPILAIRGTELTDDVTDMLDNTSRLGVGWNQFQENKDVISKWLASVNEKYSPAIITGHSLGGALAQWFGAESAQSGNTGRIVTFNAPGISHEYATKFRDALRYRQIPVRHYIANGDLVSMAGAEFVQGHYLLANFKEWDLRKKHSFPVLLKSYQAYGGTVLMPNDLKLSDPVPTSWLNNHYYFHTDKHYHALLKTAFRSMESIPLLRPWSYIPIALMYRGTTEAIRKDIGKSDGFATDLVKQLIPIPEILPENLEPIYGLESSENSYFTYTPRFDGVLRIATSRPVIIGVAGVNSSPLESRPTVETRQVDVQVEAGTEVLISLTADASYSGVFDLWLSQDISTNPARRQVFIRGSGSNDRISLGYLAGSSYPSIEIQNELGEAVLYRPQDLEDILGFRPRIISISSLAGNDRIRVDPRIRQRIHADGGRGHDTLIGGVGNDRLRGGPGNDIIIGNRGSDRLLGGRGDDSIHGRGGDDTLFGQDGVDELDGGRGDDELAGGTEVDLYLFQGSNLGSDKIEDDDGGKLDFSAMTEGVLLDLRTQSVQHVNSQLSIRLNDSVVDHVLGSSFSDRIIGNRRRNLIDGATGDDIISGGNGRDSIIGGLGRDTIRGGAGNDLLYASTKNHVTDGLLDVVDGGAGIDLLWIELRHDRFQGERIRLERGSV